MCGTPYSIFTITAAILFFGQSGGGGIFAAEPSSAPTLTWPYVSEEVSPIEELTVDSPTGYHSPALVRRPPGPGPFPLVVVLHGGTVPLPVRRLRDNATEQHNVVRLLAAGYAIAVPTYSSRKEDPQTTAAMRDCLAVIERVRHLPDINSDSVFVFGGSGGGSLALELAGEAKLAGIAAGEPATVLFTGVWGKETINDLQAIMADPMKYCGNEKTRAFTRAKIDKIACPVLIVHSDQHPINKINDIFVIPMMKEEGKAPEICFVPGVRHGFYFAHADPPEATLKAFEAIAAFFGRLTHTPPTPIDPAKLQRRSTNRGMIKGDDSPRGPSAGDAASSAFGDIDWDKVRALRTRVQAGETLTPEEKPYYEKGKAAWPPKK